MKYQKKNIVVQQSANGEKISVHAHIFSGTPGPTVYLQGNLHGPEVFGTALLIELIEEIKNGMDIKGTLVIVPCANPMAVGQVAYNSMVGRWNPQSGVNWNRIFPVAPLKDHDDEIAFYKDLLARDNQSVELRLAAILRSLSANANYVLDIHTTGSSCAEHLFTYPWMHENFRALKVPVHLTLNPADVVGAFDESHVAPFLGVLPKDRLANVATWEVHHHGHIDGTVLKKRLSQLHDWLNSIWGNKTRHQSPTPQIFLHGDHLCAPIAGYYSWTKKAGDVLKIGDTYALVYRPEDSTVVEAKAGFNFTLLGIYGTGATASGEQIGWIAHD
jgi:predicted deacylase